MYLSVSASPPPVCHLKPFFNSGSNGNLGMESQKATFVFLPPSKNAVILFKASCYAKFTLPMFSNNVIRLLVSPFLTSCICSLTLVTPQWYHDAMFPQVHFEIRSILAACSFFWFVCFRSCKQRAKYWCFQGRYKRVFCFLCVQLIMSGCSLGLGI